MEASSTGNFRVDVNAIDEDKLVRGLQKIANRVTARLIAAALIVSASLIMRIETTWTLLGYPALAFVMFTLAAALGIVLLAGTMTNVSLRDDCQKDSLRRESVERTPL